MNLARHAWQVPLRLSAGAFVLNAGLTKRTADETTAKGVHQFASGTYPFLGKIDPKVFTRALSATEITIGSALLVPAVPAGVAGLALTGFAVGLLGLYLRTPGMRREGSVRPTEQGIGLAKDIWLLSIGASLVIDSLYHRRGGACR